MKAMRCPTCISITGEAGTEQVAVPLSGGRTTPGVVRVADTVRRPPASNAFFVRGLLRHLDAVGFDGAPRALGRDEQGREILSWIPGDVPSDLSPDHGDAVLRVAARLIRDYHEASAAYVAGDGEVACHNDLSPCNFVFRCGEPVAIIDFDAARPGSRARDLGYAAWLWLDIGHERITATEQGRRLSLFIDAYGSGVTQSDVVTAMLARQDALVMRGHETGNPAMSEWASRCRTRVLADFDASAGELQPSRAPPRVDQRPAMPDESA